MPKSKRPPYTVIRDTREQAGWLFPAQEPNCLGTVPGTLKTGDYSLKGYEKIFTIERKGSVAEFAQNVCQKRFERELQRLDNFEYPFIVLEFTMADIIEWPQSSGLGPAIIKKLRLSPQFLLKRLNEFQLQYKTKIMLVGGYGRFVASSLFKRICEVCPA